MRDRGGAPADRSEPPETPSRRPACLADGGGQTVRAIQRRRPAGEPLQQEAQVRPERRVMAAARRTGLELGQRRHQRLGHVAPAEVALHPPAPVGIGLEQAGMDGVGAKATFGRSSRAVFALLTNRATRRCLARFALLGGAASTPRPHIARPRRGSSAGPSPRWPGTGHGRPAPPGRSRRPRPRPRARRSPGWGPPAVSRRRSTPPASRSRATPMWGPATSPVPDTAGTCRAFQAGRGAAARRTGDSVPLYWIASGSRAATRSRSSASSASAVTATIRGRDDPPAPVAAAERRTRASAASAGRSAAAASRRRG